MADINWTVSIGGTSFTSITQSLSFSIGRASYFDTPTGNNCTLTVRNNTGQAANISEGDQIIIGSNYATAPLYFYVVEVTFQDEIAANGSTATITGVDALGMLSLFYVNDDPIIGTNNAIRQAVKLANEVYPFVPPYPPPVEYDGRAIVSDAFDPTTIGPRIVELLLTENSTYYCYLYWWRLNQPNDNGWRYYLRWCFGRSNKISQWHSRASATIKRHNTCTKLGGSEWWR